MLPFTTSLAADRPNIIFLLADDQRNDALACYGNPTVQSPVLDSLAQQGIRFDNAFCEVPICAASRASLFTGLSQRSHGYNFMEPPVSREHSAHSYPVLLKQAGYKVGFVGKFGVQFQAPGLKSQFDFIQQINRSPYIKKLADGKTRHETDLCVDAGISFIQSLPESSPFCLSISFNATHAEDGDQRPGFHFQWPESANGLYEDCTIPQPNLADDKYFDALPKFLADKSQLNRKRFYWRWNTPEKYDANMRAYYRMITGIDNAVGRLIEELKAQNLDKNTVIIYSADNGLMMGDRGLAGKWNHYEQSLRIPLIIFDPRAEASQKGLVVEQLVSNIDITPTIVDLAKIDIPEQYQGRSLGPWIKGNQSPTWRQHIFMEHHFKRSENWHGIRTNRYKYAHYYDQELGKQEFLYDLKNDPNELVNRAHSPEYSEALTMARMALEQSLTRFPKRAR